MGKDSVFVDFISGHHLTLDTGNKNNPCAAVPALEIAWADLV